MSHTSQPGEADRSASKSKAPAVIHYFNSSGEWIAFRREKNDRHLFDKQGNWIGWFPWDETEVVDVNGDYLGTVIDGDRIYRRTTYQPPKPRPGVPVYPGNVGYVGYPGFTSYCTPPRGFEDVDTNWTYAERHHLVMRSRAKQRKKMGFLQRFLTKLRRVMHALKEPVDPIGR
ncbi:hypothetical protein [Microvirga roseola]|uniref:hypothetical protein n=1 Tax=Microvirga roseola TaxID=2883126 RepID=UPI001E521925|nr:hypothetical protein [Microvirga roseola]